SKLLTACIEKTSLAAPESPYFTLEEVDAASSSPASNQASATTQSRSGGFACHVVYANVNQWNTGFQAAVTIQNTGTVGITNWTLKWTFPGNQQITNLWNGSYAQSGPAVTIRNVGYNGSIPAGGSYNGL